LTRLPSLTWSGRYCATHDGSTRAIPVQFFRIKLNNELCLPEDADKLFCARAGSQRVTKFRGENFTMSDNEHNEPQNEEAKKLNAYRRDRDLQRRGVKIDEAVRGITDDDRKMMINESLRKVNSALSVS
jgi:hypothetical protein